MWPMEWSRKIMWYYCGWLMILRMSNNKCVNENIHQMMTYPENYHRQSWQTRLSSLLMIWDFPAILSFGRILYRYRCIVMNPDTLSPIETVTPTQRKLWKQLGILKRTLMQQNNKILNKLKATHPCWNPPQHICYTGSYAVWLHHSEQHIHDHRDFVIHCHTIHFTSAL